MYKIPSRANKLAVKSRSFQREFHNNNLKGDEGNGSSNSPSVSSGSRTESPDGLHLQTNSNILIHQAHRNHNKLQSNRPNSHRQRNDTDMIRFVQTGWNQVMIEYQKCQKQGTPSVVYYKPQTDNSLLKDFKPVDLERWYVQRMLQNMDLDTAMTTLRQDC